MGETRAFPGFRSGEIARRTGVSADTLRHYERRGLLAKPRRRPNGYRAYPPAAVDRVLLIQRALGLGFTLDELARFVRDRDGGRPPCRSVRDLATRKLREVDRRLDELSEFRKELKRVLADWDARLAASGDEPARLLESLVSKPEGAPSPLRAAAFENRRKRKDRS